MHLLFFCFCSGLVRTYGKSKRDKPPFCVCKTKKVRRHSGMINAARARWMDAFKKPRRWVMISSVGGGGWELKFAHEHLPKKMTSQRLGLHLFIIKLDWKARFMWHCDIATSPALFSGEKFFFTLPTRWSRDGVGPEEKCTRDDLLCTERRTFGHCFTVVIMCVNSHVLACVLYHVCAYHTILYCTVLYHTVRLRGVCVYRMCQGV